MVEETFEPGMTVSLVARRYGVAPNQLFTWRRTAIQIRLHLQTRSDVNWLPQIASNWFVFYLMGITLVVMRTTLLAGTAQRPTFSLLFLRAATYLVRRAFYLVVPKIW
jgi:hypothetical protein